MNTGITRVRAAEILMLLSEGRSYDQVLRHHPDLTYMSICDAAELRGRELLGKPPESGSERLDRIKSDHPRAYESWETEEDDSVRSLFESGVRIPDIAHRLQRQPSAIRSRLRKLGLIAEA